MKSLAYGVGVVTIASIFAITFYNLLGMGLFANVVAAVIFFGILIAFD